MSFNIDLMLVKALDLKDKIIQGYFEVGRVTKDYNVSTSKGWVRVKPYSVCRNSGIRDKNGTYVYEFDLLKLTHGMKSARFGFLVWDEFYKAWKIRCRTDRTAYNNVDDWTIEVIGNIVLNGADADVIYNQEKEENKKETFIDNSYCPSKFKR